MTPINNQSFTRTAQLRNPVPSRNDARLNAAQLAQAKSFQAALNKVDGQTSRNTQSSLPFSSNPNYTRDISSYNKLLRDTLVKRTLPFRIDLQSGVGAKALHDLQQIGPLTHQQVSQLVLDIESDIQSSFGQPSFDTKLEQLKLATLMEKGFESMAYEDGKPGLSAADIRRAAAKDGNPNNFSGQDINHPNLTFSNVQTHVDGALKGKRDVDLRSGAGAKALHDLQNIGSLTRQQALTLRSDLQRDIQQLIRFHPERATSTKLDQIALASLILNGFERNAAEDGRPGFSAEDLRRVAARTGDPNILSGRDT